MPEDPGEALAIDGGTPLRTAAWPSAPVVEPATDASPVAVLEAEFAASLGLEASAVIAYADADAAFDAALASIERTPDRTEAILPELLGDRLAAAAQRAGWRIVPAEVEPDAATISTRGIARSLTPAAGLVGVAHAFGHPPLLPDIARMSQDNGVPVVEDATDGIGASYREEPVGRLGRAVFTLGGGQVLSGGAEHGVEAGALLVFRDAALAAVARAARDASDGAMAEPPARTALTELRESPSELETRRRMAWEVTLGLRGDRALAAMPHGRWMRHGYARYVVRLRSALWKRSLEDTLAAIRAEGVPCGAAVTAPLHLDPAVRAALDGDERIEDDRFPAATRLAGELIAIPLHGGLTSREMDQVVAVLRKVERWST